MKLGAIVNPEFTAAVSRLLSQEIPGKTAFKLRKIVNVLSKEIESHNQTREGIIKRLCEKNEDGSPRIENDQYHFSGDAAVEVNKELAELGSVDVAHDTLSLSELGDKFSITGSDAITLSELIKD